MVKWLLVVSYRFLVKTFMMGKSILLITNDSH